MGQLGTGEETTGGEIGVASLTPLDITFTVDFVVGTQSLSLEELRSLTVGNVFEFPGNASGVSLRINGRTVGSGRLVEVGDHLGVVVETLGAL